jgi:hypothetical protein
MWSLRVRVKQRGKTENHTVQADPAEPLAQLVEKIRTCAGIGARRKIALAHGYPPQILAISASSLCQPLGSSGLANSESINVQFPSAEGNGASAATTASAAPTGAMSATASEANAKDKARKGRPKRSATTNQSRSAGAARAGVATLGSRAKRPRSKAAWAKLGGGNVLEASVEAAAAAAASASPLDASAKKDDKAVAAVKRQQSVRHTMDAALLQAAISMNGGSGEGDADNSNADEEDALVGFFRTSLKDRVAQQYQDTLATSRHKAALAGLYKFSEKRDEGQRLGGEGAETISTLHAPLALLLRPMVVEFKQEVGGWTQEEFNLIPENMLRVSIQTLANDRQLVASDDDSTPSRCARDCLRAYEMSKSARMFWSLVHLHGGDVRTGLGRLLPDEDWSDLDSRKRELSAKAKYNLNQEAMLKKARQEEEEEEEADDDVASNSDGNNQTSAASLATDDVGNAEQGKEDEGSAETTEQPQQDPETEKVVLSDVVEDEAAQTWLLNTFGASTVDELANLDVDAVKQAIGNSSSSSNINTAAAPGADVESAAAVVAACGEEEVVGWVMNAREWSIENHFREIVPDASVRVALDAIDQVDDIHRLASMRVPGRAPAFVKLYRERCNAAAQTGAEQRIAAAPAAADGGVDEARVRAWAAAASELLIQFKWMRNFP